CFFLFCRRTPRDWGEWDKKDWVRVLTGMTGEKIQVGCRKVEGSLYEKASSITISGNLLDPSSNITAKLCPTIEWGCNKQDFSLHVAVKRILCGVQLAI
uniref:Uncharacterized protein n=1 Tax=Aquila chrysaetos chrysaetos TaxID=223781 RepID=A0A663FI78_AQUCH